MRNTKSNTEANSATNTIPDTSNARTNTTFASANAVPSSYNTSTDAKHDTVANPSTRATSRYNDAGNAIAIFWWPEQ